jgi:hypothetical protein
MADESLPTAAKAAITEQDIKRSDVPRRSFLRGIGFIAGTSAVTLGAAGCASMGGYSDRCDPVRSDNDPSDPPGAASDSDNAVCDSD